VDLTYEGISHIVSGYMGKDSAVWDPDKYEIALLRTPFGTNPNLQPHVAFNVALDGIKTQAGKPAIGVLREMMGVVDGILSTTEAECRRLKFIR
jgi:hypothetical protein